MKRHAPEEPEDETPLFAARMDRLFDAIKFDPVTEKTPPLGPLATLAVVAGSKKPSRETYRDAVAAYLLARPNQWVGGMELAKIGGAYAWRTRVSDARLQLGMTIENRLRREGEMTVSEYRAIVATSSAAG